MVIFTGTGRSGTKWLASCFGAYHGFYNKEFIREKWPGENMHSSSYTEMSLNVPKYLFCLPDKSIVCDVGSYDVNGSYRAIIEPKFQYVGIDLKAGPNVDVIMKSEYDTGLPENHADAVISGQCLEHCKNPFKLVAEMFRIVKRGRLVMIVAPFIFNPHRYPVDCWRFLPDGMTVLIETAGAKVINTYINAKDCWGIGQKQ